MLEALRSGWLTNGPLIEQFEAAFGEVVGAEHAIAVNSGTAALHLALLALEVPAGRTVLTSPLTFVADAAVAHQCGCKVDFVDVEGRTGTLDPLALQRYLSQHADNVAAVIAVDYAGHPADWPALREVVDNYGILLIQDGCHSLGGAHGPGGAHPVGDGAHADVVTFSFHPTKAITTGEGGMLTTADKLVADAARLLRNHHLDRSAPPAHAPWAYRIQETGYNYRMPTLAAALGLAQLPEVAGRRLRREAIARQYDEAFADLPLQLPPRPAEGAHGWHLYTVRTPDRLALYNYLVERHIQPQVHYIPLHLEPAFRYCGHSPGSFYNAERWASEVLSLPFYPQLTDADIARVIAAVRGFFR